MASLRKLGTAAATAIAIAGIALSIPTAATARGHGGHGGHRGYYHGGGRHGGSWRGFGIGLGTGLALGAAPYWGGYYGGPYAYDYGGGCYIRRYWVINRYGHRVLVRRRVCY
jgi:hypothetical protein